MATITDTAARERWEKENAAAPSHPQPPTTVSGVPIDALYTPDSLNGFDPETDLGYPGQYLFDGVDLGDVSVSMTINAPAIVVMAFFLANAQDHGVDWQALRGTLQNDILKEFHAQNEFVFPPEPSVRLVDDVIEFCARHVPQ